MNKIDYLKKIVLEQKYVKRFIQKKWPELAHWVSVKWPVETIDLEKTYESYLHNNEIVEDIIQSKHEEWRGALLKDSLYVEFLGHFKDVDPTEVSDEAIRNTLYYQDAKESLKDLGHFRGNTTEADIMAQTRYYLNLYKAIKDKTFSRNYDKFINVGINHSKEAYTSVVKILDPVYYLVCDGHHRLACYYVAGKRFVKARVMGVKKNRLHAVDCGDVDD